MLKKFRKTYYADVDYAFFRKENVVNKKEGEEVERKLLFFTQ
jgi:hypothetical protein